MKPIGRIRKPDEVNAVMWLCSDDASFVTGASYRLMEDECGQIIIHSTINFKL